MVLIISPCKFKNSQKTQTTKNTYTKAVICKILYNYFNDASEDNLPRKRSKNKMVRNKITFYMIKILLFN